MSLRRIPTAPPCACAAGRARADAVPRRLSPARTLTTFCCLLSVMAATPRSAEAQTPATPEWGAGGGWRAHDQARPRPETVEPAGYTLRAPPPASAVVLFDGRDLSQWVGNDGNPARWRVQDGYMEVVPGSGGIRTREGFGDVQLHVEFASPLPVTGSGQDRGNSGIMLMGARYEVQVLDSYQNQTYADGQAAAIYGQFPPRFNASRPPGEWQTYDIFFRRPRFAADGSLLEPARLTVLHNGILVQNNEQLFGQTAWLRFLPYEAHADELPLELQDHGDPVRFRNIWAIRLPDLPTRPATAAPTPAVQLTSEQLDRLVGAYDRPGQQAPITIARQGDRLFADFHWRRGGLELVPLSDTEFTLRDTDGRIVFETDRRGRLTGALVFHLAGAQMPARRAR
jgi:hypothetical protein